MIKKIFSTSIILLFVTAIFLPGCSKEEKAIENWILGTWNVDKYVQQDFEDGKEEPTSESESTNQGEIVFRQDGTGEDIGGNFMGSVFTWTNTDKALVLTQGQTTTTYDIESYSTSNFVFSITIPSSGGKSVERWYFSK